MKPTLLTSSQLSPTYNFTQIKTVNAPEHPLLLSQDRVIDAFTLLHATNNQHMYLADFNGLDRSLFIKALLDSHAESANQYLVAYKDEQQQAKLRWQEQQPGESAGVLASRTKQYQYLSGTIRRQDLIGTINRTEHSSQYQPGAFASCQLVFICAESLWKRESLWEFVMQTLNTGHYRVSSELSTIPLGCKVVLVGNSSVFSQLYQLDGNFKQHFPLLGEIAQEIDLSEHNEQTYQAWLNAIADTQSLQLADNAYLPLFKLSARITEHQNKLSLDSQRFVQLLAQAKAYSGSTHIDASHINKAIQQQKIRHNSQEVISSQNFDDRFIGLSTSGEVIGQVNGLTVIDLADYSYGEPARITASVHYGDGEVADIERKSELGGNIHAKGMMILSSCLYRIFGKDAPLHLNANIVFEQSYQEIDGDSASLAEYCCLISAIAEQPILQSLAVTGAIDQFGNVQAIGGVNEKIEGFFNLCQRRGLTGTQGIIIPKANTQQLNLCNSVIQAIEKDMFSIYQVEHIDQAVELLMGTSAGDADAQNQFEKETLYGMVQARLDQLAGQEEEPELTPFAKVLTKLRFFR